MQAFKTLTNSVKQQRLAVRHTTLFVKSGQLWGCGLNDKGQLGLGDSRQRNVFTRVKLPKRVLQATAGYYHTALITESGELWVTGGNTNGQLGLGNNADCNFFSRVELSERVVQVAAGYHTLLLTESGQL